MTKLIKTKPSSAGIAARKPFGQCSFVSPLEKLARRPAKMLDGRVAED